MGGVGPAVTLWLHSVPFRAAASRLQQVPQHTCVAQSAAGHQVCCALGHTFPVLSSTPTCPTCMHVAGRSSVCVCVCSGVPLAACHGLTRRHSVLSRASHAAG